MVPSATRPLAKRRRPPASGPARRPAATRLRQRTTSVQDPYKPITDYGIIGDLHTVALVGIDGSIDWFCYPRFDSPSLFAAILDHRRGGRFRIASAEPLRPRQLYFPDTNVLITRFLGPRGVGEVTDFMPIEEDERVPPRHAIVRRVTAVRGTVPFELLCRPAFDYGRSGHTVRIGPTGALFRNRDLRMSLATRVPLEAEGRSARASFRLRQGQSATFVLAGVESPEDQAQPFLDEDESEELLRRAVDYWRGWLARSTYRGRWREMVHRSALALKLLTYRPTGAIVAAPTTSLPEEIGGSRNWDYRYTWIRDAAFTLYALLRIGFTEEAYAFMAWLEERIRELEPGRPLRPVYRVDGGRDLTETTLANLRGYRGSRPVRIGNGAGGQLQLDIYGALMDAVYVFDTYDQPIPPGLWSSLRRMLDWLCDHWKAADHGIWEIRNGAHQFVHSKVMCWVALDRGLRLAERRGFPASVKRWREARDAIHAEVLERGWDEARQAFVQSYGAADLDASSLLMPIVRFVEPKDTRMLATLDAIQVRLTSDHLVYRYDPGRKRDGLPGEEGTFSLCTFWLVEALTRAGRLEEARLNFEKMLGYANRLGLYPEQIGTTGEGLGNFPQAFTHLALISAAYGLDRALDARD